MLPLILTIKSVQRLLPFAGILALIALVGGLYLWGDSQRDARAEAEATAVESQKALLEASEKMRQANEAVTRIKSMVAETEQIMAKREQEKESTREALRAASWTISQLRRNNAELRAWLDRPIPPDIYSLLVKATSDRDKDRKADTARATATGLPTPRPER